MPTCQLEEHYHKYMTAARSRVGTTETGYYEETGCLFPCDAPAYEALPGLSTRVENKTGTEGVSSITFMIQFVTGRHELREEYLIYDKATFNADVGGYLGLLLGHSIYSVLGSAVECIRRKLWKLKNGLEYAAPQLA